METVTRKNYQLIFLYLIFYGLSVGVWTEFSQLWLNSQEISISNIGIIVAIASLITSAIIILITKFTKKINEIIVLKVIFLFKFTFLLIMTLGSLYSIKWLSILGYLVDCVINNLIILITYPILTYIIKNEKIYSKRKLVEYTASDLGVLVSSVLIGKSLWNINFDYNFMLILSLIFTIGAATSSLLIKNNDQFKSKQNSKIKTIFKDKILIVYLIYYFIGQIAYYSALGMLLLLVINYGSLTPTTGGLFIVICYVLGDVFGYLALKKLTPKNDYFTILIKFGMRFIVYLFVILFPIKEVLFFAISISLFVSRAYENKTDGIYINRLPQSQIFIFSNIRYGIGFVGKALGVMICGLVFEYGLRYIFGVCAIFLIVQISLGLYLVKMRNKEKYSYLL